VKLELHKLEQYQLYCPSTTHLTVVMHLPQKICCLVEPCSVPECMQNFNPTHNQSWRHTSVDFSYSSANQPSWAWLS